MTFRSKVLGGAAAVAFAGLIGITPAFAHTSQPATPEEMQQTDALNAQALANAQGQPAAPAIQPEMLSPAAPMTTAAATPQTDMAAATPLPAGTPLNAMAALPSLAHATVQGADGTAIGTVKDVVDGTDGKPSIVDVALNDNSKVVAIAASELSFDQTHNVLIASLTDEQIKALPAANG